MAARPPPGCPPRALRDSLGSVVDQDALPDGEGAVVPHQEEVEDGVRHPGVQQSGVRGQQRGSGTEQQRLQDAQHPAQAHLELRRNRQEKDTMSKMMVR